MIYVVCKNGEERLAINDMNNLNKVKRAAK